MVLCDDSASPRDITGMSSDTESVWWGEEAIRAVTLYPWATMDVDGVLAELADRNVNTVMVICKESDGRVFYDSDIVPNQVPERDLLAEFVDAAGRRDMYVVPVFLTLTDKYLLEQDPSLVQVARDGTPLRYPNVSFEWMHWVCPSNPAVRDHVARLATEISEYDVDGIRFSHLEFQPVLNGDSDYLSCFCEQCVDGDETVSSDDESWLDYRANLSESLLTDLVEPFDDDRMINLQVEVFADMESTLRDSREKLGLDIEELSAHVDTLSPRTAHVDMGVHPLWIRDVTRAMRDAVQKPILPTIRTASSTDPENPISPDELHTAIQMALHGGASGLTLFSDGANIGRLTDEQWDAVEDSFDGIEQLKER